MTLSIGLFRRFPKNNYIEWSNVIRMIQTDWRCARIHPPPYFRHNAPISTVGLPPFLHVLSISVNGINLWNGGIMKRQTVSSPKTNTFEWIPICALVVHPDLAKLSPLDPDKIDYYRQAFLSEGINVAFPIRVVRKGPSTYQILNGRHRYFAACAAGINEVFCLIISESEKHITKRF